MRRVKPTAGSNPALSATLSSYIANMNKSVDTCKASATIRRISIGLVSMATIVLSACGTVESAARDDCTSIGWNIGSAGYEDCFRARVRERNMDYSRPSDLEPKPSLI